MLIKVENEYTSFIFIDFSLRTKQVADAKRVFTEAENVDESGSLVGGVTYFPAYAIHLLFDKNGK